MAFTWKKIFLNDITVPATPFRTNLYTVPSNTTAILTDLSGTRTSGTGTLVFKNNLGGGGTLISIDTLSIGAAVIIQRWVDEGTTKGRPLTVLTAGDILISEGSVQNDVFSILISGAEVSSPDDPGYTRLVAVSRTIPASPFITTEYTAPVGKKAQVLSTSTRRISGAGTQIYRVLGSGLSNRVQIKSGSGAGAIGGGKETLAAGDAIESLGTVQGNVFELYVSGIEENA